jgi:hypothetical protein
LPKLQKKLAPAIAGGPGSGETIRSFELDQVDLSQMHQLDQTARAGRATPDELDDGAAQAGAALSLWSAFMIKLYQS